MQHALQDDAQVGASQDPGFDADVIALGLLADEELDDALTR